MKAAVIVLSDPNGGDEALGRLFNALALARGLKVRKEDVRVLFQGAGTRWASKLHDGEHPAHALYKAVEDVVEGVSEGCAVVFGARGDAEKHGYDLVSDNHIPGTSGLASLARLAGDGYTVITF
jgi:hypothetical protein